MLLSVQDFATQVFHWVDYKKAVRDAQQVPGKFVTPELGEWLHGPGLTHSPKFINPLDNFSMLRHPFGLV